MTEIVAAHLERVADDVTDKLANTAAFYTMEYMAAKERGEHMPHGLDSVLKPIVAAALAACARESRKEAFEEAARVVDGLQTSAVRNRMARLIRERAVGEKAT